jgi:hypothetical protein
MNKNGQGLIVRGVVSPATPIPKKPGIARQTPRVSITIRRTALAKVRLVNMDGCKDILSQLF